MSELKISISESVKHLGINSNFTGNYFRFFALMCTAKEYFAFIKDDLVKLQAYFIEKEMEGMKVADTLKGHRYKCNCIDKRVSIMKQRHDRLEKFLNEYIGNTEKSEDIKEQNLVDDLIDLLHNAVKEIEVEEQSEITQNITIEKKHE